MQTTKIEVGAIINADANRVWDAWTKPEHITQWNSASEDWHCPSAANDLRKGGKYVARMEARDGSVGFDFEAIYDEVVDRKRISYTMTDGRQATTTFADVGGRTKVTTVFDAENEHPADFQKAGWQAIMDNFKRYVEGQRA